MVCAAYSSYLQQKTWNSALNDVVVPLQQPAMASLVAILDLKGKSLIQRSYKDDIPASAVDKFMPIVLDMEEDLQTVTPCFSKDGINYMHIRYSNLYCGFAV